MADSAQMPKNPLKLSKETVAPGHPLEVHHLAHDLRGPLNSILGFSELLLEGIEGPLNETQTEDISAIYQSAQSLLLLINNIVDISKIEAKRVTFDFEPVDLKVIFQNVALFDFGAKRPPKLELDIAYDDALPLVWGDATRIEQIFLNVIRFAFNIKRMGRITLAAVDEGQTITISLTIAEVVLSAEEMRELFELTVTVDENGRSELSKGGLELPLARGLVESQGGQIWAENRNDTAIIIYIKLPSHKSKVNNDQTTTT